ncbi:MAG: energy transducer TonB [Cytophaga sp.]|uniref:energy transducer TonB n=1 Tax=Cytophaga sp. TaxID=29535 RepID=UPI003F7E995E
MGKYDIHKNKALPSDDEINKYKNFDKVMKRAALYDYKQATKPIYKNVKVLGLVAVLVALGLIFLFESMDQDEETKKIKDQADSVQTQKSAPEKDTIRTQSTVIPVTASSQAYQTTSDPAPAPTGIPVEETQVTPNNHTTATVALENTAAHFPGGEDALKSYLEKNIKYPYNAVESPYSGMVEVDLVIEKTGKVGTYTIYSSPNAAISNEITRVIKSMPNWKPAIKNGASVATTVTVYFPFKYIGE